MGFVRAYYCKPAATACASHVTRNICVQPVSAASLLKSAGVEYETDNAVVGTSILYTSGFLCSSHADSVADLVYRHRESLDRHEVYPVSNEGVLPAIRASKSVRVHVLTRPGTGNGVSKVTGEKRYEP